MPIPKVDTRGSGVATGDTVIGYWWSEYDWQWWPVTLSEIWEASGNTSLSMSQAFTYANEVLDLPLRYVKPTDGERPKDELYRVEGSGRSDSTSGGGGRGGGAAATYVRPDEKAVLEQVKSYVVATTGTADQDVIDSAIAAYMKADKQSFEQRDKQQIDPWTQMQGTVRQTKQYKAIHQLRPDSVDEMDWVTGMQGKLRQLGLSAQRAEELGMAQAQAGATDQALMQAANIQSVSGTGLMLQQQREQLKRSASAVARLIR